MIELLRIPLRQVNGYFLRWYYNGWHYWQFFIGTLGYKTEGIKYRTTGVRTIELSSGVLNYEQVEAIRSILNTTEVYLYTDGGWAEIRLDAGSVIVLKNELQAYEVTIKANLGSRQVSRTGNSPVVEIPEAPMPEYCEVIIGTQIWMCRNWDAAYPGSKVYNNDEANREIYGGLYTYNQIMGAGFCPEGWHIPSNVEWATLIEFCGGALVAGGKLKEAGTTHWTTPNTGADDAFGFTALPGGGYFSSIPGFDFLNEWAKFWTSTDGGVYISTINMVYNGAAISYLDSLKGNYLSVRMIKDEAAVVREWTEQTSPVVNGYLYGVSTIDADNGFAVGNDNSNNILILNTTDGITWTRQTSPVVAGWLYAVNFINTNVGWAVGRDGSYNNLILATVNGGTTWTQQMSSGLYNILNSVSFINANVGWVVGSQTSNEVLIFTTTNGGSTWTQYTATVINGSLKGVSFIDVNTGWAVGQRVGAAVIITTTNGGATWTEQTSPVVGYLNAVNFINVNVGWAVGYDASFNILILNTLDGGVTWTQQISPVAAGQLNSVSFIDANIGWAVGSVILTTTDGGNTWLQDTSSYYDLTSCNFISSNIGWAIGNSGSVIKILKYS